MNALKVGVIGAGAIGEVHLEGFHKNQNCKITAIASRTEEHASEFAKRFNIPSVYSGNDWKEMLKECDLDLVSICSPNYLHFPMIMRALDNDIHILCEKPICISKNELESVEKELNKRDLLFFTAFHKRRIPIYNQIKQIVEKGLLGKISIARHTFGHLGPYISHNARSKERWFFDSNLAGGGVALDLGVHSFDILRYILGEIKSIDGYNSKTNCIEMVHEDTASMIYTFQNNALGVINVSWCCSPIEYLELFGTNGSIQINLESNDPPKISPNDLEGNILISPLFLRDNPHPVPHHLLINHLIECIIQKKEGGPNFEDGKKAVEFILDAYSLKEVIKKEN